MELKFLIKTTSLPISALCHWVDNEDFDSDSILLIRCCVFRPANAWSKTIKNTWKLAKIEGIAYILLWIFQLKSKCPLLIPCNSLLKIQQLLIAPFLNLIPLLQSRIPQPCKQGIKSKAGSAKKKILPRLISGVTFHFKTTYHKADWQLHKK